MPVSLRRRHLSCFYCGQRSKYTTPIAQFHCDNCEAVNHLDEKGQITDPPAPSTPAPSDTVRYARPTSLSSSPSDIFCQTCLKNQHLLKETLASYLPSEDDPQYEQYLESYDTYREKLEQRYPQVCSQCAPRARERIKKSAYVAKTDHLRRMIERTKGTDAGTGAGHHVKSLLFKLGGIGWIGSAVAQTLWHILAVTGMEDADKFQNGSDENFTSPTTMSSSFGTCVQQALEYRRLDPSCSTSTTPWMPTIIMVAIMTIWWNKRLRARYLGFGGSLVGLGEYYLLQGIVLAARISAFYFLRPSAPSLKGEILKGAHLSMAMLILTITLISQRIVQVDNTPRVSFHMTDDSVLPNVVVTAATSATPQRDSPNTIRVPFPINKLATPPWSSVTRPAPYQPPTPPPEEDYGDPDAMDWTPSNRATTTSSNFRARAPPTTLASTLRLGPSPFHGTLPAAPMAPAHRLRKPPALQPGAFRKASESERNSFFANHSTPATNRISKRARRREGDDMDDGDTTATEDEAERHAWNGGRRIEMDMAAPRFWPAGEAERDTGLESMFEDAFSIRDTPREVMRATEAVRGRGQGSMHDQRGEGSGEREGERWGGFGARSSGVQGLDDGVAGGDSWKNAVAFVLVPVGILGVAFSVVKGGWV